MDKIDIITTEAGKKAVVVPSYLTRDEVDTKKLSIETRIAKMQEQKANMDIEIAKLQAELATYTTYTVELEKVEPTIAPVEMVEEVLEVKI